MDAQQYFEKMKYFEKEFLDYLDNGSKLEDYSNLTTFFKDQLQRKNRHEIKETLMIISKIAANHNRSHNFFDKIDKFLNLYKDEIKQTFSNFELFSIFKLNKRILLFLINESLITIDKSIFNVINDNEYWNSSYVKYFFNECKRFLSSQLIQEIEEELKEIDSESFEEKRKNGLNDSYICELIRKDSIDDFIVFTNQNEISPSSTIKHSIFETNELLNKYSSLIHYAAFYGSIKIFKYLTLNKAKLMSSLWPCAIHGKKAEIIHFLEENKINPIDYSYRNCLIESVKCYHNDLVNYFLNTYLADEDCEEIFFEFHNYNLFPNDIQKISFLFYLCSYNYVFFVEKFLQKTEIDLNEKIKILKKNS